MNKFSAHKIKTSEFIQKLHPWYIHPPQGGHPQEHPCNSSRACDAPSPAAACPSQASHRPATPVHLCTGKGPTGTFDADGALDDLEPRTGLHQPPHQPEIAPRQGLSEPQPNYEALHGLFGRLVELDQLFQLVAQGHRVSGLSILRPEHLLRRAPLLGPVECGSVGHTAGRSVNAPGELRIRVSNK